MRSYIVKENHNGSAVSFGTNKQTDTQIDRLTDILLLMYKDNTLKPDKNDIFICFTFSIGFCYIIEFF